MHLLLHLSNLLKPLLGPKKKISPLDDIHKDPYALYALLKLKWKEEEATDNHGLEYELSSKASVTNNPYYPYNWELFGHDEEDAPDLAEDWFSYLSGLHKGQNATIFS